MISKVRKIKKAAKKFLFQFEIFYKIYMKKNTGLKTL